MSQELLQAVRRLEKSNRRWRLLAVSLSAALALVLVAGVAIGVAQQRRAAAARDQAEQARQAARAALDFLEQGVHQAQPAKPQP
jgi:hypothetical protein